jgi:hypothetical protein
MQNIPVGVDFRIEGINSYMRTIARQCAGEVGAIILPNPEKSGGGPPPWAICCGTRTAANHRARHHGGWLPGNPNPVYLADTGGNPMIIYLPSAINLPSLARRVLRRPRFPRRLLLCGLPAAFLCICLGVIPPALLVNWTNHDGLPLLVNGAQAAPAALAPGFFVSPGGDDGNPGTLDQPFLTLARCQTAMQGSVNKTCYLRAGIYNMSSTLTLGFQDQGETWTYYPPDGVASPALTQTSAFAFFTVNTGADNVSIIGLSATGFEHKLHGACTGGAYFVSAGGTAASGAGPANLTVINNVLSVFDCAVFIMEAANPVVSFNQVSIAEYVGIGCNHCAGAATKSTWQGNIIYDTDPDGTVGTNAYPVVFSTGTTGVTSNITALNNQVYNSPTWVCYDDHGGTNIQFINNLCVGPGSYTAFNHVGISRDFPIKNIVSMGNIIDNGFNGTTVAVDSIVMCGIRCQRKYITGSIVKDNIVLMGAGNGTRIVTTPPVTVSGNVGNIDPEQVSSIKFQGGVTNATFVQNVPNAVVAMLAVTMSNTYWAFPTPPGVLTIGGKNSGGFIICNQTQICQPSGGAPVGTYNDFTITATLHGMYNSPFTAAAGTLTLKAQ